MDHILRVSRSRVPLLFILLMVVGCASTPVSPSPMPVPVAPSQPTGPSFTVTGTVRDAGNLNLLANVSVLLTSGSSTTQAITAFEGSYSFAASGTTITLTATAPGYERQVQEVAGGSPTTVDFRLRRTGGRSVRCGAAPDTGNRVLSLFSRPFQGEFRLTNYFDHDLPLDNPPNNGFQLTFCGDRATGRIDAHQGYDWLLPARSPVLAVAEGTVAFAGVDSPFFCPVLGRMVSDQQVIGIDHPAVNGERFRSVYIHLARLDVTAGQTVSRGQVIGLSGTTGCSTEPHLHLQVVRFTQTNSGGQTLVDPYGWEGVGQDPWAQHPAGSSSIWLWRPGEAPALNP
ncbi:MAG: peptidoglycan DD-metalloendopeptidase family protein [Vicinamibacterales bacterium]